MSIPVPGESREQRTRVHLHQPWPGMTEIYVCQESLQQRLASAQPSVRRLMGTVPSLGTLGGTQL